MSSAATRWSIITAQAAVTIGAVWLLFHRIDWVHLASLLERTDPIRLTFPCTILAFQFALMVRRWQLITELIADVKISGSALAIAFGRSLLIGQPLLSTVGGDIARIFILSSKLGLAPATRSVICDRVAGSAALVVLAILMFPFLSFFAGGMTAFALLSGCSFLSLAMFFLLLAYPQRLRHLPWAGSHLMLIVTDLRQIFSATKHGCVILFLSLAIQILSVTAIYGLAMAIKTKISFLECLIITPPALLLTALPISLGGWGVREGALAAGFDLAGASSEAGFATSVLFGLSAPLTGVVAELIALKTHLWSPRTKDL